MSSKLHGMIDLTSVLATLPEKLERNILRGALKAGAEVFADGSREECRSAEVRATIKTSSRAEPGLVTAKIQTKGPGAHKAPWLEYGTDPHFISVDDEQSEGRTVRRINTLEKKGSIVIGGNFVGKTVHHPGAKPYPFMRPPIDNRQQAAVDAMVGYASNRIAKVGLNTPPPEEPEE